MEPAYIIAKYNGKILLGKLTKKTEDRLELKDVISLDPEIYENSP